MIKCSSQSVRLWQLISEMLSQESSVHARKRCVCRGGILRACQFRYYLLFLLERHLKVFEHMYVVTCRPIVVFSVQAVVSFSLLCLSTVAFCLELILFYMEGFYKCSSKYVLFISPGDGGHGYLRDWLWWAGLLTSKYDYI